ncbi:MAG: hypothetical protein ACHQLA_05945 [Ignavibacteriales bacterium]
MKKILLLMSLSIVAISCSKKEEANLEAFSPEAFAYDIGDSWEVNATVNVKGFTRTEIGDEFSASIEYSVDLSGPESLILKQIFADSIVTSGEELIDVQLEAQFELDYESPEGLYKITFNITDNKSGETTSTHAEFELKK